MVTNVNQSNRTDVHIIYLSHSMLVADSAEVTHITETIQQFQKHYEDITIVVPRSASQKITSLDIKKHYSIYTPFASINRLFFALTTLFFLTYRKISATNTPTILYIRHGAIMPVVILIARMLRLPVVLEVNTLTEFNFLATTPLSKTLRFVYQYIEKHALQRVDAIVSVSHKLTRYLQTELGIVQHRLHTIHNGANIDLFIKQDSDLARQKHGLATDCFYLGFVGHLRTWHAIDELLHSYKRNLSAEQRQRIHLLIVGGGILLHEYQQLVETLGIADSVELVGGKPYTEVPEWIACMDVCLAPSQSQQDLNFDIRSPIKVYEYLACGRPVLASSLGSLETLFADNQIGYLIPNGKWDKWWKAVLTLEQDVKLRHTMGYNARRVAETELSWEETVCKVAAVIETIV